MRSNNRLRLRSRCCSRLCRRVADMAMRRAASPTRGVEQPMQRAAIRAELRPQRPATAGAAGRLSARTGHAGDTRRSAGIAARPGPAMPARARPVPAPRPSARSLCPAPRPQRCRRRRRQHRTTRHIGRRATLRYGRLCQLVWRGDGHAPTADGRPFDADRRSPPRIARCRSGSIVEVTALDTGADDPGADQRSRARHARPRDRSVARRAQALGADAPRGRRSACAGRPRRRRTIGALRRAGPRRRGSMRRRRC